MTTNRKPLNHLTQDEIAKSLDAFKYQLGVGGGIRKSQSIYDYETANYKVGAESIYNLDVLTALKNVGIGAGLALTHNGSEKNLLVTTGAFPIARINATSNSPNRLGLAGSSCYKVLTIFIDIDFKDQKRAWYHQQLANGYVSQELANYIEGEISFLRTVPEFNQAPNACLLSKNGFHFHYHLSLVSGWSSAGIQYLLELPETKQKEFCTAAGISSINDLQVEYFDGEESNCIRSWWVKLFEKKKFKEARGYDEQVLDIGARKCREIGMWHTKDINNPWLMRPFQTSSLSTSPITPTIPQPSIKEEKAKLKDLMEQVIDGKKSYRYLDGTEIISIGTSGKKAQVKHETITVQELANNWSRYLGEYGTRDKIQACLDFVSPEISKPYESIGGAFVSKAEDDALLINLVHPTKPKSEKGSEISLFVLPSQKIGAKLKAKAVASALQLDLDPKSGKVEKSETNLRIILQKDPLITSIYKLDILRGHMVVHHLVKTSSNSPSSCIQLDKPIAEQVKTTIKNKPFCKMKARQLQDEDFIVLQAHIKQVYGVEYARQLIIENIKACFSTNPDMDLKFNLVHDKFLGHYDKWIKAGRPSMLNSWLPDTLQVSKSINPAYYDHLSMVGRKLLIGMTSRAYSFADPTKLEMMFCITGKSQGTGKSTFSETLIRSLLDLFGVETATAGEMDSRFILSTRQDDNKSGDKILSYEGKLIYQLEEFGSDQVKKSSANQLKNAISEKSVEGRSAYERFNRSLNFTHFIISTTNDRYFLHEGDGDQRRFLILDLDYVGTDGYYAIPLDGKRKPINWLKGNEGFIDRDLMASLLDLAFGEAYARAINGELEAGTSQDLVAVRSAKDILTGQPTDQEIPCEMPRLSQEEKAKVAAFNKRYEMGSERMREALITYFRNQTEDKIAYKFHDIEAGVKETIGFIKHQNQVTDAMASLDFPLVRVEKRGATVWRFVDRLDSRNLLNCNPYAGIREDEDENKTMRTMREQQQTISDLEKKIKELENALKKKETEVVRLEEKVSEIPAQEIVIVSKVAAPSYTPELEEDEDDDEDFVWEIVPSKQEVSTYPKPQEVSIYPKPQVVNAPPTTKTSKPIFVSPLDDLDENNLDPEVEQNLRKKFKKH